MILCGLIHQFLLGMHPSERAPSFLLPREASEFSAEKRSFLVFEKAVYTHTHTFRGFQKWGYLKHGWFMSWKTPSFEMDDDWGYPFQETPTLVAVLRK